MQTKKSQYRQRGYTMNDGSVLIVYGNGAAPENFVKLEWDNLVTETSTSEPYVEPVSGAV